MDCLLYYWIILYHQHFGVDTHEAGQNPCQEITRAQFLLEYLAKPLLLQNPAYLPKTHTVGLEVIVEFLSFGPHLRVCQQLPQNLS